MTDKRDKTNIDTSNENLLSNEVQRESEASKRQKKLKKENLMQKEKATNDNGIIGKNKDEIKKIVKDDEKLTEYKEETIKLRDERLRLLAEMENLRKRNEREKIESIKFGNANLARDILSTSDNLTRALENIPEEKNRSESTKNIIEGLKMVQKEFITILARHGVKKIDAVNKKFDHNFHQAILEIERKDKEEGIVVQEIQSGYTMHDRLLRPTMVGVSKKPQNNKKKE